MFNQNDFLAYLGMDDNNGGKKPAQQRSPRKQAPKPVIRPLPAVSNTFASPGGSLTAQPTVTVVSTKSDLAREYDQFMKDTAAPPVLVKDIELVPYSDKSFSIFGNTRPIQKQLKDLGGSFNRWLKRDGVSIPGFIFSNKRLDSVRKALNI